MPSSSVSGTSERSRFIVATPKSFPRPEPVMTCAVNFIGDSFIRKDIKKLTKLMKLIKLNPSSSCLEAVFLYGVPGKREPRRLQCPDHCSEAVPGCLFVVEESCATLLILVVVLDLLCGEADRNDCMAEAQIGLRHAV